MLVKVLPKGSLLGASDRRIEGSKHRNKVDKFAQSTHDKAMSNALMNSVAQLLSQHVALGLRYSTNPLCC